MFSYLENLSIDQLKVLSNDISTAIDSCHNEESYTVLDEIESRINEVESNDWLPEIIREITASSMYENNNEDYDSRGYEG